MNKKMFLVFAMLALAGTAIAQPASWRVAGIGGGGAFFRPSINPGNDSEYYIPTDMGSFFHTTNFGASYNELGFRQLVGGALGLIRFTYNPAILYGLGVNVVANKWLTTCYKSMDGGERWSLPAGLSNPSNTALASTGVALHVDYDSPNRLVLGTQSGLFYSANGGETFTEIDSLFKQPAGTEVYPAGCLFDGDAIYVGTNYGVLISQDGGARWQILKLTGIPNGENIFGFAAAKQNGTVRFFCITGATNGMVNLDAVYTNAPGNPGLLKGVYRLDYGSSTIWEPVENGVTIPTDPNCSCDHITWIGMAENDISTVYLYGVNGNAQPTVLKTSDGGANWNHVFNIANNENIYTGYMGDKGDPFEWWLGCSGLDVAKKNSNNVVLANMGTVYNTRSGGTTWEQAYVNPADQNPMGSPTPRYKTYRGIGLENTSNWFVHWSSARDVLGCLTDIGSIRSTDGGASWAFNQFSFNTMYCAIEHPTTHAIYCAASDKHDMYASTALQDQSIDDPSYSDGEVLLSTDKGFTWGIIHDFTRPVYWIAFDPNNPNTMYASIINHKQGLGGIWMTNDLQDGSASAWKQLPAPPRTEGHPAMVIPLKDGKVVCTYSGRLTDYSAMPAGKFTESSGVFLYDPSSSLWTDVTDTTTMAWYCNDIVVDPNDPSERTWYVGVSSGWGYTDAEGNVGPNDQGGLFKTTNRGQSWKKLMSTSDVLSPGGGVFSCSFNPNDPNQLYITSVGDGLFVSNNINDTAPTFLPVSSFQFGYPLRPVFNPYDRSELWVTTFGNGIHIGRLTSASVAEFPDASGETVRLFPNPANDYCMVETESAVPTVLRVRDLLGRNVMAIPIEAGQQSLQIDTKSWNNGLYFVNLGDRMAAKILIRQ